jgi:hypothetical protein
MPEKEGGGLGRISLKMRYKKAIDNQGYRNKDNRGFLCHSNI